MPIMNALASVAVRNLGAATTWYERLFGRPPDSQPMPEVAEWHFAGGGWLQVYQQEERAGTGSVTLAVTDLEEQAVHLTKYGMAIRHRASSMTARTLMITDPDGNHIAFAQPLERAPSTNRH